MGAASVPVETADRIWDVLVEMAGASELDRDQFVAYLTDGKRWHEYRFIGCLGFGGKLHHSRLINGSDTFFATCYPEHETYERWGVLAAVNARIEAPA